MPTRSTRRVVAGYALLALAAGVVMSAWLYRDLPGKFFKHTDGSITTSAFHSESWTDPGTGEEYTVRVKSGRPLPILDRAWVIAGEAYPILIAWVLVGACWGFVWVQIGKWLDCPFGDPEALDYEDSTGQNRPPGSTW
jgi:hypothetical protein